MTPHCLACGFPPSLWTDHWVVKVSIWTWNYEPAFSRIWPDAIMVVKILAPCLHDDACVLYVQGMTPHHLACGFPFSLWTDQWVVKVSIWTWNYESAFSRIWPNPNMAVKILAPCLRNDSRVLYVLEMTPHRLAHGFPPSSWTDHRVLIVSILLNLSFL